MKKMIFATALSAHCLLITIASSSQQKIEPPTAVKYSFTRNFKDVQSSRWIKLLNNYVCTFSEGLGFRDAYFTNNGEFKGVGQFVTFDMLPSIVQNTINTNYRNLEILELYQYDCSENGFSFYAVLRNEKKELILNMTPDGQIVYCKKSKVGSNTNGLSDIAKNF